MSERTATFVAMYITTACMVALREFPLTDDLAVLAWLGMRIAAVVVLIYWMLYIDRETDEGKRYE